MAQELHFHAELLEQEFMALGCDQKTARDLANRRLGSIRNHRHQAYRELNATVRDLLVGPADAHCTRLGDTDWRWHILPFPAGALSLRRTYGCVMDDLGRRFVLYSSNRVCPRSPEAKPLALSPLLGLDSDYGRSPIQRRVDGPYCHLAASAMANAGVERCDFLVRNYCVPSYVLHCPSGVVRLPKRALPLLCMPAPTPRHERSFWQLAH